MKSVQEYYNRQWSSSGGDMFALAFTDAIAHSYSQLGKVNGKKLLEIGCGSGEQAVYFASQGAAVTVIDISPESLKATLHLADEKGVKINALQMNAEDLQFPADSFDLIYINSTLMHVNQLNVLQECSRVLKKDGKLVIIEPLRYALFVQLYRLLGSYRKMKPRYATLKMFKEGKKYFADYDHKEFYFFSSLLLPVFFLKNRFLHKIYYFSSRADNSILRLFPFFRYGCWVSVAGYRK